MVLTGAQKKCHYWSENTYNNFWHGLIVERERERERERESESESERERERALS